MPRIMIGDPRTRKAWASAIRRCTDHAHQSFPFYGGRGITVVARWRDSFETFLADMGRCPPGHSLDRLDSNGDYGPANCRWATKIEQMNNTRANRLLVFRGETKTVAEWAHALGVRPWVLFNRLYRGWSIDRALSTPVADASAHQLTVGAETLTLREWAVRAGITKNTLVCRLERGWLPEKAVACARFRGGKRLTRDGHERTVTEWARHTGIPASTIYRRLSDGWPVHRVLAR